MYGKTYGDCAFDAGRHADNLADILYHIGYGAANRTSGVAGPHFQAQTAEPAHGILYLAHARHAAHAAVAVCLFSF